jgi:hypothetical protein
VDEDKCEFVKQQTCSTKRKNGMARCEKWHKKYAAKLGANSVVIITGSSEKTPFMVNNQFYTASDTSMTADYYNCNGK